MHALYLLTLFPFKHVDDGWRLAAFRSATLVMEAVWGSHSPGRQAAGQQLACNGLVPVLPDASDQPAQQAPPAEGQLSPAAAALQAALLAHVPAVSLDPRAGCVTG